MSVFDDIFGGGQEIPGWFMEYQRQQAAAQSAQMLQGFKPIRQLTEEDVRRIVREEIRAALSAPEKP
jgi:hypothetical protein